ncbi:PEP-utilizing enzyme [Calothrix sp. NIES-3974]
MLVVPNAEASLTPISSRIGGVVIETGGRLSHDAILTMGIRHTQHC